VERKIAVVTRRVKATLNAARLLDHYRKKLWGEAIMFVTDVENMLLSQSYEEPGYIGFFKEELTEMKGFRQFGEIAYVKFGNKTKGSSRTEAPL
jgi:hypothetical protein